MSSHVVAAARALAGASARSVAAVILPPVVTLGVILALWQGLTGDSMAGLPSPVAIWRDSKELILNPFYDRGGVDKGLFWHALTSLKRVAVGFSLFADAILNAAPAEAAPRRVYLPFGHAPAAARRLRADWITVAGLSPVDAAVTCTAASVAASRSPLIALPLSVGDTSTTSSSTMLTTIE